MYRNKELLLLISKDRNLKKFFRSVLSSVKYQNIELLIQNKFLTNTELPCIRIIFVDISYLNSTLTEEIMSKVSDRYIAIPVFVITDSNSLSECPIEKHLNYGVRLVLQKPVKRVMVESILHRHMRSLRDKNFDFKKYHGLILNEKYQYVIYNRCKVFLSRMECYLLSILIEEGCPLSCDRILTFLESKTENKLTENSVRVSISRIRKKFREGIGLDIIKNKYGVGYYIAV